MRDVDFCVLMALVRCGGVAKVSDIVIESGYSHGHVSKSVESMTGTQTQRNGWAIHITESGRIALAIAVGKQSRQRGRRA